MSTAKKEEIARLMVAWRKAKEDVDGAKAYAGWHPVCSICSKSKDVVCVRSSDGIRCSRCKEKKVGCPRLVDFWIFHIARQLKRSETYVRNLYNIHCRPTRRYRGRSGSERTAGGSSSRGAVVGIEEDEDDDADIYTDWDEDQTSMDDEEKMDVLPRIKKPKMKATVQNSTSASTNIWRTPNNRGAADWRAGVTHNDSKSELAILKKENELLKHRAETAEGNFVALVGRVQDFRTSLRSEIHAMPSGTQSFRGLSRLSTAMETTIDDSGLYLRNIQSDALKQSRTSWEIQHRTKADVDKAKEGGSKEPRQQIRRRSPEPVQKRRKI